MFSSNIKCLGFTYEEVEDIMKKWNSECIPTYEGAIVRAYVNNEPYEFATILNEVKPDFNISPDAVSIYCEVGYIHTRRGIDVVVIDGIQEDFL